MNKVMKTNWHGTAETFSVAGISPELALAQVEQICQCNKQKFFLNIRGRGGNPVRTLAAWWLVEGAGVEHAEAAEMLQTSTQTVKRAVQRVRVEGIRRPNSDIVKWSEALRLQTEPMSNRAHRPRPTRER